MKNVIYILMIIGWVSASAQTPATHFTLKGKLIAPGSPLLDKLPVTLLNTSGKTVKIELATSTGDFIFEGMKPGNYVIEISGMGFKKYRSAVIALQADKQLPDIRLEEKENRIDEVAVQVSRPAIQHQFGKTILNVANSISAAGSTAMEVLEKAPGVMVDQNDNISLRGKQGIMVMIDGKRVPMSGAELASLLRSTSADNVDRIELVTNPSSKYDAQGNAGIIDIRLKKDSRLGTNGTVTGSFGQGQYSKVASGASFNTREKDLNLFGSYNYNHRKDFIAIDFFRRFLNQGAITGIFRQDNFMDNSFDSHNYRFGADYNVSKSTVLGVIYNGLNSRVGKSSDNKSLAYTAQDVFSSSFLTTSDNMTKRNVNSFNLNVKHNLDDKGREFTADLDYAKFDTNDDQNYLTRYFKQDNTPGKPDYLLNGDLLGNLDVRSIKADYAHPLQKNAKLEFGAKSSLVKSDNDVRFYDASAAQIVPDPSKSNHFIYKEYIHAAYFSGTKSWKRFDVQLGLRMEHTNADGLQLKDNTRFDRFYTQLFPNIYAGYKLTADHQVSAALSRRINRPTYNQLNPFKIFLDTTTYVTGNPYLKPELTNAFELSHIFKNRYITKLSFSHTSDNIITVLSPDPNLNNVIAQSNQNLASLDFISLNVTVPVNIGKWWVSTNNFLAYYGQYSGNVANTDLDNGRVTFNFNSNNQFRITSTLTAEFIGSYNSKAVNGFLNIDPVYTFNAGVQKQIFNKQGSIKLNVSDLFLTNNLYGTTVLTGYKEEFRKSQDTRVATLSLSYRFGKSQVGPARRRTSGAEEEKRRAGGS